MNHLLAAHEASLRDWLSERGHPAYRCGQLLRWVYQRRCGEFDEMTDLPRTLQRELAGEFHVWSASVAEHQRADDGAEKLLLELSDGARVECVLLRDGNRRSICISTQAGCAMGCVFCASGLDGLQRNLTRGEIIEQMLRLQRLLPPDERLSHIVVMGMGEPMANLPNLLPALDAASQPDGLGISARRITISTVGVPQAIEKLARANTRYHLAISLHAPNDELRNRLVPANKKTGLSRILSAADHYFEASGRRLTYEYVLLDQVNDRPQHARQLARLLAGRSALINLIPYNKVAGLPYREPTSAAVQGFIDMLEGGGLTVKCRRRKGHRIQAACGQLRRSTPVKTDP